MKQYVVTARGIRDGVITTFSVEVQADNDVQARSLGRLQLLTQGLLQGMLQVYDAAWAAAHPRHTA